MPPGSAHISSLLEQLSEDEVCDEDEEVFNLFSGSFGSHDLGMLDAQASSIDLTVAGRDLTIHQSPGILVSNRSGGTTGAVVWKMSVPIADWLASPLNVLFRTAVLDASSTVLELGAGVGVVGIALAPMIQRYIMTDQDYMLKLIQKNVHENSAPKRQPPKPKSNRATRDRQSHSLHSKSRGDIEVLALDWETSEVSGLMKLLKSSNAPDQASQQASERGLDAIVACDCIFNESLVDPFVQTCAALCSLRASREGYGDVAPTICIIAQQLRSSEVFEIWIRCMRHHFRVWTLKDPFLSEIMTNNYHAPYVVHLAILRNALGQRASIGS